MSKHVVGVACGLALSAVVTFVQPAAAQSTIFNIPSTDTVAAKKVYVEFDYLPELPTPDAGAFQIFTPRLVAGVTSNLEVGVNFANTHIGDGGGWYSQIQPDAKFKFYADDDKGLAATAGVVGYFAVNKRDVSDDFGLVYANISKKTKGGTRVTAGGWASLSYIGSDGKNTAGALLGLEQPITPKISFVADWFSGKNFWGYFTPGISITLPHNALVNVGYSIGNNAYNNDPGNDTHNKAIFVYYGIVLN